MSDANEFLKAINILTNENNKDRVYKTTMEKEIERLLKENKEKNKIIEQQKKHIEAFKQKGNRYIEVNEKDRIIIYDTKKKKFSWRTCWSDLPSNIIDDLYKNELINYYKHNVLKIYNKERIQRDPRATNREYQFHQTFGYGYKPINECFSFHLLKNVKKVRGVIRNIANEDEFHSYFGSYNTCIAICKNGNKCKCKAYDNIYEYYNNPSEYNYLYNIKNWSRIGICSRHARSGSGEDKKFWLRKYLNENKKVHKQDYNKFSIEDRSKLFEHNNEVKDWDNSWIQ